VIILHGLFGSSDNWYSIANHFAGNYKMILVDQRNHGRSFHHKTLDYNVMSRDLENLYRSLDIDMAILIGHSMGGKTAMKFSLENPAAVEKLIVLDIAPKKYPIHHDEIIEALCELKVHKHDKREELDQKLAHSIPNKAVRQFLLKNLIRDGSNNLKWRINLPVIKKSLAKISQEIKAPNTYDGPTLFIAGSLSHYVKPEDEPNIKRLFPNSSIRYLKNAGHWIHADAADEFIDLVSEFIGIPK
jgi:pimeloyl-ACP methyl ester carboxylesterase